MGVMKRVSMIFRSKANKALDKMEDPRETLDYSYKSSSSCCRRSAAGWRT